MSSPKELVGKGTGRIDMRYTYPALFEPNELGGHNVQFLDFEEGATCGDTFEESVDMAAEVLELLVDAYLQDDKALPEISDPTGLNGLIAMVSVEVDIAAYAVSTQEAADMLDVTSGRVRQMLGTGQLRGKKRGRDNYVYVSSIAERLKAPRNAGRPKKMLVNV